MALLYQMQRTTITLKAISVVENTEDQYTPLPGLVTACKRRYNYIYQHQYNKRVIEIGVLCCIIEGDQLHLKFSHWRTELSAISSCLTFADQGNKIILLQHYHVQVFHC